MMKGFEVSRSLLIVLITPVYFERRIPPGVTNMLSAKVALLTADNGSCN